MADPIPPAEHVADAMKRADEVIAALKRAKPSNEFQARARAHEMIKVQQGLIDASRRVTEASVTARVNGNGHAPDVATRISDEEIAAIARGFKPFIREFVAAALAPLLKRIDELEARPQVMKYQGVWDSEKVYANGDFVTDDGSLWHCSDVCRGVRPGSGTAWQLAVKRGRDGNRR
jgi:hypothetical protein